MKLKPTFASSLLTMLPADIAGPGCTFHQVVGSTHYTARGITRRYNGSDGRQYQVTVEPIQEALQDEQAVRQAAEQVLGRADISRPIVQALMAVRTNEETE